MYSLRDVFVDYFIDLFSMIVKSLNSNKINDNLTRTDWRPYKLKWVIITISGGNKDKL